MTFMEKLWLTKPACWQSQSKREDQTPQKYSLSLFVLIGHLSYSTCRPKPKEIFHFATRDWKYPTSENDTVGSDYNMA